MKKFFFLLLLLSIAANAQTHRFIYEYQFKSDSLAKEFRKENMVLDINPTEVKFYPYFQAENDSINKIRNYSNSSWDDEVPTLKRERNTNRNINYVLFNDFFAVKTSDEMVWILLPDTKKVGNYNLQKATTKFGGRKWTAWFNTEVNSNEGPYKFRGLPGLIFEVADDKNNFKFSLLKSYQLKDTYDTSGFMESFAGKKPIMVDEKTLNKKRLELFNDPLYEFKEKFKNDDGSTNFSVMGVKIKSLDQFKELTVKLQDKLRQDYNPIELDKAVHYPIK